MWRLSAGGMEAVVTSYLLRRLFQSLIALWGVLTIVFLILHLSGDPALLMIPQGATQQDLARLRQDMGLDRPLAVQYAIFLANAVRGDFGTSFLQRQPALGLVLDRVPATLQLALSALLLSVVAGVSTGVVSAWRRNTWWDRAAMVLALVGQATPSFWLSIMLILVFAVWLKWLPPSGYGSPQQLVLPAFTLGILSTATISRMTRSSMLEVLGQEYVKVARAKGLQERTVLFRHAMRNAAIPVVTLVALELGVLLSGAVIVETIFAWPGIGRLAVDSILARDFPVVQAIVFLASAIYIVLNLLTDLLYTAIDPRIRLA